MQTVQVPEQVLIFHLFCETMFLRQRSWKRRREFARWNQPFYKSVLTPSLVKSSRSIQHMRTVQVPKQVLIFHLFCGTKPLPHRSKKSGREFAEWNHPSTDRFLHPSLVQSSRSIQCMQTVQAPKQVSYLVRICWVEPIPIWPSSFIIHISLVQKVHLVHVKSPGS